MGRDLISPEKQRKQSGFVASGSGTRFCGRTVDADSDVSSFLGQVSLPFKSVLISG